MSNIDLAVIAGDGIGPEVVTEGLKVLDAVTDGGVSTTQYDLGAKRWHATGETLPDSVLEEVAERWRPFRSWAAVHLRALREQRTREMS